MYIANSFSTEQLGPRKRKQKSQSTTALASSKRSKWRTEIVPFINCDCVVLYEYDLPEPFIQKCYIACIKQVL